MVKPDRKEDEMDDEIKTSLRQHYLILRDISSDVADMIQLQTLTDEQKKTLLLEYSALINKAASKIIDLMNLK